MKTSKNSKNMNVFLFIAFVVVFGFAFLQLHLRIQTTLIGYRLGQLKSKEVAFLEQRSYLQMELAKITTKDHLSLLAESKDYEKSLTSLAAN